jgi:hypothetical protein
MRALLSLLTLLAGATDAKQTFENDCLYCHSDAVIVKRRMRPSQWRGIVAKMQARAPLLISRRDADVIVRYIVRELKLVPPRATPRPVGNEPAAEVDEPVEETPPPVATPTPAAPPPVAAPAPPSEEDTEAETLAPRLLAERCSKCHSLFRVFTKLDSAATAEATIERMRRKTGSGISAHEADLLKRFARSRAAH